MSWHFWKCCGWRKCALNLVYFAVIFSFEIFFENKCFWQKQSTLKWWFGRERVYLTLRCFDSGLGTTMPEPFCPADNFSDESDIPLSHIIFSHCFYKENHFSDQADIPTKTISYYFVPTVFKKRCLYSRHIASSRMLPCYAFPNSKLQISCVGVL